MRTVFWLSPSLVAMAMLARPWATRSSTSRSRSVSCGNTGGGALAGVADQGLLAAERHAALREAFDQLPPNGKQLISLLIADPPLPYADISARLGIPVGSIGPNRSRYLDKMRRHPAVAALINA